MLLSTITPEPKSKLLDVNSELFAGCSTIGGQTAPYYYMSNAFPRLNYGRGEPMAARKTAGNRRENLARGLCRVYTSGSAYAQFEEGHKGELPDQLCYVLSLRMSFDTAEKVTGGFQYSQKSSI